MRNRLDICRLMHRLGVNMRYLGFVFRLLISEKHGFLREKEGFFFLFFLF